MTPQRSDLELRVRETAGRAWARLRGGELTRERAAASVFLGLFIGVLPVFGLHLPLVMAACLPLSLDVPIAYLAANISIPPMVPVILFAEVEIGSRIVTGAFMPLTISEITVVQAAELGEALAVGSIVFALIVGSLGAAAAYGLVAAVERRRSGRA